jgi:four helix bundle protein
VGLAQPQDDKSRPNLPGRTFQFALRIIRLYSFLSKRPGATREIGRQLLRSGTSVGANVEEAQAGQSRADFLSKYGIALKEARETCYRLRLLAESGLVSHARLEPLSKEAVELTRILASCIISTKARTIEVENRRRR